MFNPADFFIEILAKKSNSAQNGLRVQVRVLAEMRKLKIKYII